MKRLTFLFLIVFLLVLPIAFSQGGGPPITETFVGTTGFQIEHSLAIDIKQNENHTFIFHVFNLSKGTPIIKGLSCEFDLFNASGKQFLQRILTPSEDGHFEIDVDGTNFTNIGFHSFLILCNTSTEGGFFGEELEVTRNGGNLLLDNRPLAEFFVIISVIVIYFLILIRLFTEREFSEHGMIRLMFYLIAFWVVLIPLNMGIIYNDEHNGPLEITEMFELMHQIIVYLNYFITVYFILWFLVQMLKKIGKSNNKLKLSSE